ncbi:hypothetical protein KCP76_10270 [Salmonella enterica subsp. enterica serovar Weltevreden]|nr:hypothetical protein KCP76_10270 [Salmonella enterica subsp. enterica serovar Weltevreden]
MSRSEARRRHAAALSTTFPVFQKFRRMTAMSHTGGLKGSANRRYSAETPHYKAGVGPSKTGVCRARPLRPSEY